ncbi:MarR family winged helix-turn-helix transcriptional regulator [Thalassovita aquimarina]|uniref:MarR family winged helix-turn-helix transcriptional regulator n=1 Tax=Thalassovita aquimarina TaxID=2785917 RepID=UPI003562C463
MTLRDETGEMSPELAEVLAGNCYCLAMRRASRRLIRLYDAALKGHGLTVTQFSTLAWIKALRRPTVQKIADYMDIDQSALSRGLVPLDRMGVIKSMPDEQDKRKRVLFLTSEGEAKLEAASKSWKAAQLQVVRENPDIDMKQLLAGLQDIAGGYAKGA